MSLQQLRPEVVARVLGEGGLLIDLRPVDEYLARHWLGSVPLLYEAGPGLGGRARDLLPLDARLILLEDETSPLEDAAASFRGKGFEVVGYLAGGIHGHRPTREVGIRSTVDLSFDEAGSDLLLVDVSDPGTSGPGDVLSIPAERLWKRAGEIDRKARLGVLAGWGVRAATAVGILENLGFTKVAFVRTRPRGAVPPTAGPEMFRAGGPP